MLFSVNQAEAIRRGFNANSTVKLDLDVTELPEPARIFIADRFHKGVVFEYPITQNNSWASNHPLMLNQPNFHGLLEAIERLTQK